MKFRIASACAIGGLFAFLTILPAQAGMPGFDEVSLSGNYLAGRFAGKARDMDVNYMVVGLKG